MDPYNLALKHFARKLRGQMTDAEQVLWQRIRRKQIADVQFYRQKPLLNFIVDFYCPAARLVVELDGGQHFDILEKGKDAARDMALGALGLMVLRFDNRQVLLETQAVLQEIDRVVRARSAVLNPP
jgi:very-short-patch-repair endonuclease